MIRISIVFFFLLVNFFNHLRADQESDSGGIFSEFSTAPSENQTVTEKSSSPLYNNNIVDNDFFEEFHAENFVAPTKTKHYIDEPADADVKVMIRNINSGLVLDGSEFIVKMVPLLGTYTQLWTFKKSATDSKYVVFTNVANGRVLTSWPYTKSIFCYDVIDNVYTRWNLRQDRRLISAAYPQDYLTYGYGNMAISLRCSMSSDGTDQWILVESKENRWS